MQLSTALLPFILSVAVPGLATNTVFSWANDTNRPECRTCLDELVSDTCDGESSSGFRACLCDGAGATRLKDECVSTCCSASTVCTGQGPYNEWWLLCVDDYPKLCADPPSKLGINTDLEEHCTQDKSVRNAKLTRNREIDAAKSAASNTSENDHSQSDVDVDSSAAALGVYTRLTGGIFGLILFAAAMQVY
ncbi:unnamed protein product [Clonostachys rosea]|uniref:Extracellular membrane protein CFEM domain-containing protein n=1 Tax=Bionectria ochroleuca TaxID=29856 RepID=A0ABY6ULN2_BIOOC|nr:unnamed protein product [Clonostachys rosea]